MDLANDPQPTIIVSMVAVGMVAAAETIYQAANPPKNPPANYQAPQVGEELVRIGLGVFLSVVLLLGLSYIVPAFAAGLAVLALAVTVLVKGTPFWTVVNDLLTPPKNGASS